jgi:hypothetical protein
MPKSYNIEYFKNLAIKKNCKCLSSAYKTLNTKLKWQCSKGHTWESIPNSILRGTYFSPLRDATTPYMERCVSLRKTKYE